MKALRSFVSLFAVACFAVQPLVAEAIAPNFVRDATFAAVPRAVRTVIHRQMATQGNVGSGNTTTADAPVSRPNETPCNDQLFANKTFASYSPLTFKYVPPAACPGPYAKIVFNVNFSVSAGIQYDRTASIEVGNLPLFFGTTAEPTPSLAPSWHVARDVTDEAALLSTSQKGEADIFNVVNSQDTGVITASAALQFYPVTSSIPAAVTPDVALAFPNVAGGPQQLTTGTSALQATYTLPTNVERVYLDVYAQSQSTDEQFFNCAPSNVANELFACPDAALRLTEIKIDGTPAGVAPVYPWIYTGGLDPYLWAPIPGVQTLEFEPYRVNLTPFASLLANGSPHTISLLVEHADSYFQAIGTLLAYEDHGSTQVTGALSKNTLTASTGETTVENLTGTSPSVDGTIQTSTGRTYAIAGYVTTSAGTVATTVAGDLRLLNYQTYANESADTGTFTAQASTTASTVVTTVTTGASGTTTTDTAKDTVTFPLSESLAVVLDQSGNGTQVATVDQLFLEQRADVGPAPSASFQSNEVRSTDTLDIQGGNTITGNSNQASSQIFAAYDTLGNCYVQSIAAANNVITAVSPPTCNQFAAARNLRKLLGR